MGRQKTPRRGKKAGLKPGKALLGRLKTIADVSKAVEIKHHVRLSIPQISRIEKSALKKIRAKFLEWLDARSPGGSGAEK